MKKSFLDIRDFLQGLDALFAKEDFTAAGDYLRQGRDLAEKAKDRGALLTILSEMMGYYRRTGERERGLEAVETGFRLLEETGLSQTISGGTVWLNGGTALCAFGKPDEAEAAYRNADSCYASLPDDHPLRAGLLNNISSLYLEQGRCEEAVDVLNRALVISQRNGIRAETAVIYVNLAQAYAQKDPTDARIFDAMDRAWDVLESAEIPRDAAYAETARKCAGAFGYFGYFVAEKELHERADALYERA